MNAWHCYTIIKVCEAKVKGQTVRLLQLRNPWGKQEWNGAWSDQSSVWTTALRKELGSVIADDGFFFITLDDFVKNFKFTNICKYNDDDVHSYAFRNKPVPKMSCFEIEIDDKRKNGKFEVGKWGLEILVN